MPKAAARLMTPLPRLPALALRLVAGTALALLAVAGTVTAAAPQESPVTPRTALYLLRAPLADRIVIGDSRVQWGVQDGQALFVGYGGARIADLSRLTQVLCRLSDAEVVLALGTNDAKVIERDPDAALAALEQMVRRCGPQRVLLAEIWPGEPGKGPSGRDFDAAMIARLNAGIGRIAQAEGVPLIPAPVLSGHTHDGIHFTPAVSRRYLDLLARSSGV